MSAPLNVGIVGFGYWGPKLLRNFTEFGGTHVKAVADLDPKRRAAVTAPWVETAEDYHSLLQDDDIDAIVVATPLFSHYSITKAALLADKHVLVETPMADTEDACTELITLADEHKRTLMVDHTCLYSGAIKRMREMLDDGRLGEVMSFDSVRVNLGTLQPDYNVIWDLASHDLAVLDYLLTIEPDWISVHSAAHHSDNESLAHITIGYEDETLAHIHCNWVAPAKSRKITITGADRMMVFDDLLPSNKLTIYETGVDVDQLDVAERHHLNEQHRLGDVVTPRIDTTEPLRRMVADFARSCVEGTTPLSDAETALRVVAILEAAQESIEQDGERIEL